MNKIKYYLIICVLLFEMLFISYDSSVAAELKNENNLLVTDKYDKCFNCDVIVEKHNYYDAYVDETGEIIAITFDEYRGVFYFFNNENYVYVNKNLGNIWFFEKNDKAFNMYREDNIFDKINIFVMYAQCINKSVGSKNESTTIRFFDVKKDNLNTVFDDKYIFTTDSIESEYNVYNEKGMPYKGYKVTSDYILYDKNWAILYDLSFNRISSSVGHFHSIKKIYEPVEGYLYCKDVKEISKFGSERTVKEYYFSDINGNEILKDYDYLEIYSENNNYLKYKKGTEEGLIDYYGNRIKNEKNIED